jgi:hypothetical protein
VMALATVTPSVDWSAGFTELVDMAVQTLCDFGRAVAGLDQDISALGT